MAKVDKIGGLREISQAWSIDMIKLKLNESSNIEISLVN